MAVWTSPFWKAADWCAILMAHQLLWQNIEAPESIFQESPLKGEPHEGLFHIHSIHHYQLCTKYPYLSTLLKRINGCNLQQKSGIIQWCYLFCCWKFNDVWLNIRVFCAPCIVEGNVLSFADRDAEVLQVQVKIFFCLLYMTTGTSRFMQ